MSIIIPNYEPIIANQTYRESSDQKSRQSFLCLERVKEIYKEQVREYIKKTAFNYECSDDKKETLYRILEKFPEEIRQDLLDDKSEIIEQISKLIPAERKNGHHAINYLRLSYGILTESYIKENLVDAKRYGLNWYLSAFEEDKLLEENLGGKCCIQLLLANNKLPKLSKMEMYLEDHVKDSDSLKIDVNNFSFPAIKEKIIKPVYTLKEEDICQIPDATKFEIEGQAIFTLDKFYDILIENKIIIPVPDAGNNIEIV